LFLRTATSVVISRITPISTTRSSAYEAERDMLEDWLEVEVAVVVTGAVVDAMMVDALEVAIDAALLLDEVVVNRAEDVVTDEESVVLVVSEV
jgi:hypothetical protein